jgi:hypothetical protein
MKASTINVWSTIASKEKFGCIAPSITENRNKFLFNKKNNEQNRTNYKKIKKYFQYIPLGNPNLNDTVQIIQDLEKKV